MKNWNKFIKKQFDINTEKENNYATNAINTEIV